MASTLIVIDGNEQKAFPYASLPKRGKARIVARVDDVEAEIIFTEGKGRGQVNERYAYFKRGDQVFYTRVPMFAVTSIYTDVKKFWAEWNEANGESVVPGTEAGEPMKPEVLETLERIADETPEAVKPKKRNPRARKAA